MDHFAASFFSRDGASSLAFRRDFGTASLWCFAATVYLLSAAIAFGGQIPNTKDFNTLRKKLKNEGYLSFVTTNHGEEYTGYTDKDGRDWSDNWFTVKPIIVEDKDGLKPTRATPEHIAQDLDFARKVFAQAGLSIRVEETGSVTAVGDYGFTTSEMNAAAAIDSARSTNADTINLYYARSYEAINASGFSAPPKETSADFYSSVRDFRELTTVAHELAHVLFNSDAVWKEQTDDKAHSTDTANLIYRNGTNSADDLDDIGQFLFFNIGGKDVLEHRKDDTTGDVQIARIHSNPGANNPGFVKHGNHHDTHGDRADFDWVSDHRLIQGIKTTQGVDSNGADHRDGEDFLVWEINKEGVGPSTHKGPSTDDHTHNELGELDLDGFGGPYFNRIDVISNINRFADNDVELLAAAVSAREKALDFKTPQFSVDGDTWVDGILEQVFIKGWTEATDIENYVSRWKTDTKAKYVRLQAAMCEGCDSNTQIDAIIAFRVPEPSTWVLVIMAGGFLPWRRWRRNRAQAD